MACKSCCNTPLYIKTVQCAMPLLAPLTPEQELRDKLTNLTGEVYMRITTEYCPFCGERRCENDS